MQRNRHSETHFKQTAEIQILGDLRKSRTTAIVRLFQARKKVEARKVLLLKWPELESNQRHKDFQSSALPTELSGHERRNENSGNALFLKANLIFPYLKCLDRIAVIANILTGASVPKTLAKALSGIIERLSLGS